MQVNATMHVKDLHAQGDGIDTQHND
jgi:hypothetical protein